MPKAAHESVQGTEEHTLLKCNETTISRLTNKYMGNLNITDIAIFDWNAMMVFDYKGTNYDALNPTLAKGT